MPYVVWLERETTSAPTQPSAPFVLAPGPWQECYELCFASEIPDARMSDGFFSIRDMTTETREGTQTKRKALSRVSSKAAFMWTLAIGDRYVPLAWADSLVFEKAVQGKADEFTYEPRSVAMAGKKIHFSLVRGAPGHEVVKIQSPSGFEEYTLSRISCLETTKAPENPPSILISECQAAESKYTPIAFPGIFSKPNPPTKTTPTNPPTKTTPTNPPTKTTPTNPPTKITPTTSRETTTKDTGSKLNIWSPVPDGDALRSEACVICMDLLEDNDPVKLSKCPHAFHLDCLEQAMKMSPICPVCKQQYGVITGNQPKGEMRVRKIPGRLEGFSENYIYEISYSIPSGIQGPNHPSPGSPYRGTNRTCYLPTSQQGELALKMLQLAFDRKLIFAVGKSVTSGAIVMVSNNRDNVTVWNGIHHKTSQFGGPTKYGYPDPTYFDRLFQELADRGILPKDVQ